MGEVQGQEDSKDRGDKMKTEEYEKELKSLYELAIAQQNTHLALEILERGRAVGIEDIRVVEVK